MGRVQVFDTDEVVRAARSVFWVHGYDAASLPDLERATGLSRSSIYNSFGSKRGLFDAAVQSYLTDVIRPRLHPLIVDPVAPGAIMDYFDGLHAALLSPDSLPSTSGCLLVNAASASIGHEPAVAGIIADYRAEMGAAIAAGVDAHLSDTPALERDRIAEACAGLVIAAFALVRVDPARAAQAISTARDLVTAAERAA